MIRIFKENKKSQLSTTASVILIAFALFGLFMVIPSILNAAVSESEVLQCRLSVVQRAITRTNLLDGSLGELQCKTLFRNVGDESDKREDVMREISDYVVRCWNMFGEGFLHSLKDADTNVLTNVWNRINIGGGDEQAFCFICYDLSIRNLDQDISYGNFIEFFENTLYIADSTSVCPPGDRECELEMSDSTVSPCIRRGGECKTSCIPGTEVEARKDDEWICYERNNICCLDRNDVYTYNDYIRFNSGMGGSFTAFQGSFPFTRGENIGVVYVEPESSNRPGYIAIGKFEEIRGSGCIQK